MDEKIKETIVGGQNVRSGLCSLSIVCVYSSMNRLEYFLLVTKKLLFVKRIVFIVSRVIMDKHAQMEIERL